MQLKDLFSSQVMEEGGAVHYKGPHGRSPTCLYGMKGAQSRVHKHAWVDFISVSECHQVTDRAEEKGEILAGARLVLVTWGGGGAQSLFIVMLRHKENTKF